MPSQGFWKPFYGAPEGLPWDLGEVSAPLAELVSRLAPRPGERALVPGCGRGHDAIFLALRGLLVTAADFVPQALEEGRRLAAKAGARGIEWVEADVLALPASWTGRFAWAFEHTCYAAIEPGRRGAYLAELHRALAPGGRVAGVFFDQERFAGPEGESEGPPYPSTRASIQREFENAGFLTQLAEPAGHDHRGRSGRSLSQCLGVFEKPGENRS